MRMAHGWHLPDRIIRSFINMAETSLSAMQITSPGISGLDDYSKSTNYKLGWIFTQDAEGFSGIKIFCKR